jgi:DUF4097 and DUF4098 domain-containing protein YvlB
MIRTLRLAVRVAAVAAAAAAIAACEVNLNTEGLTAKEKRTFTVSGQPDLTLETFNGAIEIHSWDRNEVEVEVERRAMDQGLIDQMKIEAEQDGDRVTFRVTGPAGADRHGLTIGVHISPAARLYVAVPRKILLNARTSDGSIKVENLEGRLTVRTGDGSVALDRTVGEIEARSGDGSIRLEGAEGRLDIETEDGSITVDGKPTVLRARTGDGSIRVQVQPETRMTDAWDISTRDGSVTLTLPTSFNADVDAETSDGAVRSSHPALSAEGDGDRRRRDLRAKMGEGGPALKVRTGDGTIRFER